MKKNLFILAILSFFIIENVVAQINLKGTWIFSETYVFSLNAKKDKNKAIRAKYAKETAEITAKMKNGVYTITEKECKFDKDATLSGAYAIEGLVFTLNGKPYGLSEGGGSAGKFFELLVPAPTKEDAEKVIRMEFKKQQTAESAKLNGAWKFDRMVNYDYPTIDEKKAKTMEDLFTNITIDFTDNAFTMNFAQPATGKYAYDVATTMLALTPEKVENKPFAEILKMYKFKLVNNDEYFTLLFISEKSKKPTYQLVFNKK